MAITTTSGNTTISLGQTRPQGIGVAAYNSHRKLIQWNIPTRGLVEMYINPQSFSINERKIIKETRTKGGYIIQYWGEQLQEIDISGTTGSGGIEGINILRDIYRQEQIGFIDVINQLNAGMMNNLFQTALGAIQNISNNPLANQVSSTINALSNPDQFFNNVVSVVGNIANVFDSIGRSISGEQQLIPTLAALATAVELWYDGVIYRGFFREFRLDEKADEVGIFRYSMKFAVTRRTGTRVNGFPWQRSVAFGPADSDIIPLSFGAFLTSGTTGAQPPAANIPAPAPQLSRRSLITG